MKNVKCKQDAIALICGKKGGKIDVYDEFEQETDSGSRKYLSQVFCNLDIWVIVLLGQRGWDLNSRLL
jgi:hypothetical protein